jgi:tetratricopeptide (TPR) repeat protein
MSIYPNQEEDDEIKDLIAQYEQLRTGQSHAFLDEEAFERIIDYYDDGDHLTLALEASDFAIAQFPYSAGLLIKKADLLIATKHYRQALGFLKQAEIFDANDINLYILKTEAFLALGYPEKATATFETAIELFSGNERLELLFELAEVYDDYEEFEKVFDCLKAALEQDPTNEEALYKICFWTDYTGRNEEGIKLHLQILEEHPFCELAWFNLAAAYQGLKLYEKAIDAYKYAVAIDDKFDFAYRNMGDAYLRLRKYRDAIECLQKVLTLAQPEDVVYEALGHCYDKLHLYKEARNYYRKASNLDPENSQLYYKIACTYMSESRWLDSVNNLQTAMRIYRKQPEYNLAMGQSLMELGKYEEAIEYLGVAVRARTRNINGWLELLRCLYLGGFLEDGERYISQALEQTQGKPVLYFYKAAFLFAMGKSKDALIQLETGLTLNPRLIKKMRELDPTILQNPHILDAIARIRKKKF